MTDPSSDRPDATAIRQALAECMTLADIDDAMSWSPGTARRYRWREPEQGGLPPADAEIGGVALWFRPTIQRWRSDRPGRGPRPRRSDEVRRAPDRATDDRPPGTPAAATPEPSTETGSEPADASSPEPKTEAKPEPEPEAKTKPEPEAGPEPDVDAEPASSAEPADEEPAADEPPAARAADAADETVRTGYELEHGQHVVAYVRGKWRDVRVVGRDRRTVVVGYTLDDSPLGARVQRIAVEQVRLPPADDETG